jgi:hypothetical protein
MSIGTGSILQLVINNPASAKPISYENTSLQFDFVSKQILVTHMADKMRPLFITSDKPIDYLLLKLNKFKIIKFPLDFCNKLSNFNNTFNGNDFENINYVYKIPWSYLNMEDFSLIRMTKTKLIFEILSKHNCTAHLYFQITFLSEEDQIKIKKSFCKYYDIYQFNEQSIESNCVQQLLYNGRSNGIFLENVNLIKSISLRIDNRLIKYDKTILIMTKKIYGNCVYLTFGDSYLSKQISIFIESNEQKIMTRSLNHNLLKSMGGYIYVYYPFDIYDLSLQMLNHAYYISTKNILNHNTWYSFDSQGIILISSYDIIIIKPLYIVSNHPIDFLSFSIGSYLISMFPLVFCNKITKYKNNFVNNSANKFVYKLPWDMLKYNLIELNKFVFVNIKFKIHSSHTCNAKLYTNHIYNDVKDIHLQASTVYSEFSKKKPDKSINSYLIKNILKNENIANSNLNIIDTGSVYIPMCLPIIKSHNHTINNFVNNLISNINNSTIEPAKNTFKKHTFLQIQMHKAGLYSDLKTTYVPIHFHGFTKGLIINNINFDKIDSFLLKSNTQSELIDKINLKLFQKKYQKIGIDCYYVSFTETSYAELYSNFNKSTVDLDKINNLMFVVKSKIKQNIEIIILNHNSLLLGKGQVKLLYNYNIQFPNKDISFTKDGNISNLDENEIISKNQSYSI